jgi:hypothetical protein
MNSDDIKHAQPKVIEAALEPMVGYLHRLQARMEKVGFTPSDSYFQAVARAYDATQALCMATHYLTCDGAGRPSEKKDDANDEDPRP